MVWRGVESVEFMGKQCGIIPQKSGEYLVGKPVPARFWHGFGTLNSSATSFLPGPDLVYPAASKQQQDKSVYVNWNNGFIFIFPKIYIYVFHRIFFIHTDDRTVSFCRRKKIVGV